MVTLKPSTMRACLLVSKLWYHTFLPILWHTYICPQMKNVPSEVIQRYSRHFRIFDSFSGHPGPFECTNMHLSEEQECLSLKTEKELVRANTGVRMLYWFGPRPQVVLDPGDFGGLRSVRSVQLQHWVGSRGCLARTLKMMAGSMMSLELAWIFGLSAEEFLDPDGDDDGEAIAGPTTRRRRLMLPLVTKLRCALRYEGFRELQGTIGCCPNLLELTINPDMYVDLDRIARDIRVHCRKAQALTIEYLALHASYCEQLVSSCRTSGLVKLDVILRSMDVSLVSAILAHAGTLQILRLSLQSFEHSTSHGLMQLLRGCTGLKALFLKINVLPPTGTILEVLRGEPSWGCLRLEALQLITRTQPADEEPDMAGDKEEEEEIEALRGVLYETAVMGWCRRKADKDAWISEAEVDAVGLRKVVKMVEPLQQLKSLTWNYAEFCRP
ncbi:hypothetical protein BG015_007032 [Linnemannia schmuckeri]|uniref:F-box domain-containing protein n=1 Tax=Linnemannia schmuckeri TaxID=64567 RepID=A0A9P5VB54_9FUNG|nr:hypothetical protein BG015_007032 [Linnemannia schmuckeri]